jgi:hypothetical protein
LSIPGAIRGNVGVQDESFFTRQTFVGSFVEFNTMFNRKVGSEVTFEISSQVVVIMAFLTIIGDSSSVDWVFEDVTSVEGTYVLKNQN